MPAAFFRTKDWSTAGGVRQQEADQFFGQPLVAEWSAGARKCGKPGFLRSRRRSKKWPRGIRNTKMV